MAWRSTRISIGMASYRYVGQFLTPTASCLFHCVLFFALCVRSFHFSHSRQHGATHTRLENTIDRAITWQRTRCTRRDLSLIVYIDRCSLYGSTATQRSDLPTGRRDRFHGCLRTELCTILWTRHCHALSCSVRRKQHRTMHGALRCLFRLRISCLASIHVLHRCRIHRSKI